MAINRSEFHVSKPLVFITVINQADILTHRIALSKCMKIFKYLPSENKLKVMLPPNHKFSFKIRPQTVLSIFAGADYNILGHLYFP